MIVLRFLVFTFFILNISFVKGAAPTGTHTYIVSRYVHKVLVIDRKTGEEKVIEVGEGPYPMVIHGNFGYVVNEHSFTVSVIDLKDGQIVETLENPENLTLDCSDTHLYRGIQKLCPLYYKHGMHLFKNPYMGKSIFSPYELGLFFMS